MSRKLLRFTIILLGLILGIQTIVVVYAREEDELLHAMIVNSNIRDYDQALYLMSPDGVILRRLTDIPGSEWIVDQSPDGKWLLVRSNVNFNTYSINIGNGIVREIADIRSQLLGISPDSRWAYFQCSDYSSTGNYVSVIFRVALNGGENQDIATTGERFQYVNFVGLSPDGAWLYITHEQLIRIHTETNEIQIIPNTDDSFFSGLIGWSSDGTWMYIQVRQSSSYVLYRMRADGRDPQQLLPDTIGRLNQIIIDPQTDRLLVMVNNEGVNRLYGLQSDGSDLRLVTENMGTFVGWTADPDWALFLEQPDYGKNGLYRMNVTDGQRQVVLPEATTNFWWSPNRDEFAFIRDSSSPSPHFYLKHISEGSIRDVAYEEGMRWQTWSPDNEWIYFDKASEKSSELFRINVSSGERQSVHTPALHNNYNPIFNRWIAINAASWRADHQIVLCLIFLLISPAVALSRNMIVKRCRMVKD